MSRLFTFGCSFTKYKWDTWADILGKQFDSYKNYGKAGSGNQYALNQLTESYLRDNINSNDTVAIMWSTTYREDRFVKGHWKHTGNVFKGTYPDNWVDDWCDPEGFLIRDLSLVTSAKLALDNIGCKYYMFQMMDIKNSCVDFEYSTQLHSTQGVFKKFFGKKSTGNKYIELYKPVLDRLYPSVYEVVFDNDWYSREDELNYELVDIKEVLADKWDIWKGADWPSLDEWTKGAQSSIDQEIEGYIKDLNITTIDKKYYKLYDYHPTTSMHLKYLQTVLPEYDKLGNEL